MRVVNGKSVRQMGRDEVLAWAEPYREIVVDLGAGDGRFVRYLTKQYPDCGAIGVDLVAANLRQASRAGSGNALFVLADALALPDELKQMATRLTINFPWGSLLQGLLSGDPGLLQGLDMVGKGGAVLDIVLNAGALSEVGWTLEGGGERVATVLRDAGITIGATSLLTPAELRQWPTTWAKRLAFGRDPRAFSIAACRGGAPAALAISSGDVDGEERSDPAWICYTSRLAGDTPDCQYVSLSAP